MASSVLCGFAARQWGLWDLVSLSDPNGRDARIGAQRPTSVALGS